MESEKKPAEMLAFWVLNIFYILTNIPQRSCLLHQVVAEFRVRNTYQGFDALCQ